MSRDSGAGAYSQGIACPSPRPQLLGARLVVVATAPPAGRTSALASVSGSASASAVLPDGRSVSVVIFGPLWHPGSSTPEHERGGCGRGPADPRTPARETGDGAALAGATPSH